MDWRVDSAWLLAASTLVSARVRFEEPVCSTLIRFLLKTGWTLKSFYFLDPTL
jgi:hypothetical protein